MCIADYNKEAGEETIKELSEKYGSGKAIFVKCDVTSQADMEGKLFFFFFFFFSFCFS